MTTLGITTSRIRIASPRTTVGNVTCPECDHDHAAVSGFTARTGKYTVSCGNCCNTGIYDPEQCELPTDGKATRIEVTING